MGIQYGRPLDDLRAMDLRKEIHRPWGVVIPSGGLASGYIPIISRPGSREHWKPLTPPVSHLMTIFGICLAFLWLLIAVDAGYALGAVYLLLPLGTILYLIDTWSLRKAAEDRQSRAVDETHLKYIRLLDRLFVARDMGLVDRSVVTNLYKRTYDFVSMPISHTVICGEGVAATLEQDLKEALEVAKIAPRTVAQESNADWEETERIDVSEVRGLSSQE